MEGIFLEDARQPVLQDLHLALYSGEILGVYSEHGVVKNALTGLVTGRLEASAGRLYILGEPCPFQEPDRLRHRKVGVIRSVSTLIDTLSVAENIFVIRKGFRAAFINRQLLQMQARQLMEEFSLSLDPRALGSQLSVVERCMMELVKAVALGARIVIFQDLSSFLSDAEIRQLMSLTLRLKAKGTGFLMVDSSSVQLSCCADRVSVLRNGRSVWTFGLGEFTEAGIKACLFSGSEMGPTVLRDAEKADSKEALPVLCFEDVSGRSLEKLSFVLHREEALCLLDRDGRGIAEVKSLLSGAVQPDSGNIRVGSGPFYARSPWEALDQGIAFVAENPSESMIFPDLTALENLCLAASRKTRDFWLDPRYRASCLADYAPYFEPGALNRTPDQLSAQDLVRLVYCRWHLYSPSVVVCIKPFSAVDKSLAEVSTSMMALLLKKGISVLILAANESEAGIPWSKIEIEISKE